VRCTLSKGEFAAPKTAKGRRSVSLTPTAVEALKRHGERQAEELVKAGTLYWDRGLAFASMVGTPLSRHNLTRSPSYVIAPSFRRLLCLPTRLTSTRDRGSLLEAQASAAEVRRPWQGVPGRSEGPSVGSREHRRRERILRSLWRPHSGAATIKTLLPPNPAFPMRRVAVTR
jgi:hypothetical protein